MKRSIAPVLMLVLLILALCAASTRAARPLLDQHQWDRYFALSARDVSLPWKQATVRLATYSGAPVDFAVYNIDPAEVLVAGQHRPARALNTSKRKPLARWRFAPPSGYRFEVNQVPIPLGEQEGFYVIEAHRGDATQQVWINRTHIGLITKEGPGGLLLWCVDLRSGRALQRVNVAFLVGQELVMKTTDAHGSIVWQERERPTFALAEHGAGRAFISLLPQAPLPAKIVGLRLESAGARAGEKVHFVGFARRRVGEEYQRLGGDARLTLLGRGKTLTAVTAHLDAAGAFSGNLPIPATAASGEYTVLASAGGGVGGISLRVDAGTSVSLAIHSNCPCSSKVKLTVSARSEQTPVQGLPIKVRVIRTPHILPPGAPDDAPRWGTTVVYEKTSRSDENGEVALDLPAPTDGLASSYGISANTDGASATARVTVATSSLALALEAENRTLDVGEPAHFVVRGFDAADGSPAANLPVKVRLVHGPVAWEQSLQLDTRGLGHVVFHTPTLGTNLAFATAQDAEERPALDVTDINVDPSNRHGSTESQSADFTVTLDRNRYQVNNEITVTANVAGASGDALITLEGERVYQSCLAKIENGKATARLKVPAALGNVHVEVAAVRDGAVALGSEPVAIDAPGHAREMNLTLNRSSFAPGEQALITLHDGSSSANSATIAVRIADGRESGSAYLDNAPDLLKIGGTTTQNPAGANPAWHTFVAPAGSRAADIYAAERPRMQRTENLTLGVAEPRTLLWHVARHDGANLSLTLPEQRGHYVISLLRIAADGSLGASSLSVNVQ